MAGASVSTGIIRHGRLVKACDTTAITLTEAEQKHGILQFTDDTPGGAVTITLASATDGHVWYVVNQSGEALTLKVSGGTGVAVANGKCAILYCDGTDVERLTDDTA